MYYFAEYENDLHDLTRYFHILNKRSLICLLRSALTCHPCSLGNRINAGQISDFPDYLPKPNLNYEKNFGIGELRPGPLGGEDG